MRLLVTRPEPESARTAAALRDRGHEVLIAPLLQVEVLAADLGAVSWGAVAMTSANAARSFAEHPRRQELAGLPVFAVGRRTAEAARAAGFDDVSSADGDERDLVRVIGARLAGGPSALLYLAGEHRAGNLVAALAARGVRVQVATVYRAAKASRFPAAAQSALRAGWLDVVLHYSRRSAEAYVDCARAGDLLAQSLLPCHCCLSPQVAKPLLAAGAADIRIAARPDEAALLELI